MSRGIFGNGEVSFDICYEQLVDEDFGCGKNLVFLTNFRSKERKIMFGLVHCNASIIARQNTDPNLFLVRSLMKNWLWPIITFFGKSSSFALSLQLIVFTEVYEGYFLINYLLGRINKGHQRESVYPANIS